MTVDYLGLDRLIDKYNVFMGAFVTIASLVFGRFWYLFMFYLVANVVDWLSGWRYARKEGVESSKVGLKGIVKKFGYWVIIFLSFAIAETFQKLIYDVSGKEFPYIMALGWFILANLLVNDLRSIVENFVKLGYDVPEVLTKGLAITHEAMNAKADDILDSVSDAVNQLTHNDDK